MAQPALPRKSPATWGVIAVLLIIAITGTLWVPIYARSAPALGGFPFFYWFQLIWVPVTGGLCWICYLLAKHRPTRDTRPRDGGGRSDEPSQRGYAGHPRRRVPDRHLHRLRFSPLAPG